MKVILSTPLVVKANKQLLDSVQIVSMSFGKDLSTLGSIDVRDQLNQQAASSVMLKHVSISVDNDTYTYEISDELLERILGFYTRAIKLLALFATPIKAMAALYKAEIAEITQMLLAEK